MQKSRPRYPHLVFIFLFPCVCLLPFFASAQQNNLEIKIRTDKNIPVPYATVRITYIDSTMRGTNGVSDSTGNVFFQGLRSPRIFVNVSTIGYADITKPVNLAKDSAITLLLKSSTATLKEVVVSSRRPLMREEDDKTIVDPENLIPSSTSGYEILEKTPGLFVDQDGNIYINSTTPAGIYINGREMKMSTADVATMLKSLPPNAIVRIEIMRTPSARYDASGAGGIVNVVLKKGVKLGMTGSANIGWQQGIYGNETIGANINNNNGRITSFLNVNVSKRKSLERISTDRLFAPDSLLSQDAKTRYPSNVYYIGYGLSTDVNAKWNLNYDGRISLNSFDNDTRNQSLIKKESTGEVLTDNVALVTNTGNAFLLNQGFATKYKMDSAGSLWTNDVSYTYARNNPGQGFNTIFLQPVFPEVTGDGDGKNWRHFLTAQSDLTFKLKSGYTVETGIKTSLLQFNSSTLYFNGSNANRVKDESRTSTFKYNEQIHAAYVQGSKGFAGFLLKTGVRLENTNMEGKQIIPGDTSFNIHRTDLFPYVYLSRKVITIAGFDLRAYLVYRKTISRPVYEQLNPFPRYVDQYLSETGNPGLRPQFTNNYEANISVDETPLLAIGINETKDIFTNVIYQADSSRSQAYRTYDNLGKNREFYLRGLGAIPPGKKYFFVVGGQYNHNFYQGVYENRPLAFKKGSWTFFTYHTLKLGKTVQMTLNGFIRLKGQLQFYELGPFGALNFSINKQLIQQKLILTLSANDIFSTNRNEFNIAQGSIKATGYRSADTRRFGLNLRYNFGMRKKDNNVDQLKTEIPE